MYSESRTLPHVPVGMTNTKLSELDPSELDNQIRQHFSPAIDWNMAIETYDGKSFGILIVKEAESKPVVCSKGKTPIHLEESFLMVTLLSVLVFSFFNFRPRGKAKCFAGDVGSVGIAFILLFAIGMLIVKTEDITWLFFLLVYGVDGCLTICHRILLHENLGQAHRKHAYQLMANELKMSHPVVSLIYMALQLAVSLGFIYLCPVLASSCGLSLVAWHWIYLAVALVLLALAYVLFKKKYYHLHEEYLASLKK